MEKIYTDIQNDLRKIQNNDLNELCIYKFIKGLEQYTESRNISNKSSKDLVDLMIIIFSSLEVEDRVFDEFISRLNVIQLTKKRKKSALNYQ